MRTRIPKETLLPDTTRNFLAKRFGHDCTGLRLKINWSLDEYFRANAVPVSMSLPNVVVGDHRGYFDYSLDNYGSIRSEEITVGTRSNNSKKKENGGRTATIYVVNGRIKASAFVGTGDTETVRFFKRTQPRNNVRW